MRKFKCNSIKGTQNQFFAKLIILFAAWIGLLLLLILNGYDVILALLLASIPAIVLFLLIFIPMRRYSASSIEIADRQINFFGKSGNLKFSIMIADIANIKAEPYPNIYGDRDLNAKLTIKTRQGDVFTIFLPEEGAKAIGDLALLSDVIDKYLKKIPIYMHIIFGMAVILVPLFIVLAIIAPEFIFNDVNDYIKFFIYVPAMIGFIIYYLELRKK